MSLSKKKFMTVPMSLSNTKTVLVNSVPCAPDRHVIAFANAFATKLRPSDAPLGSKRAARRGGANHLPRLVAVARISCAFSTHKQGYTPRTPSDASSTSTLKCPLVDCWTSGILHRGLLSLK